MIPRWPVPSRRRTAHAGRVAAVTVTALAAALVQPLAAQADTPPPPPSDAKLAAEPARHDDTREQFYFVLPDRFANGDTAQRPGRAHRRPARAPATTPPTRASTTAATSRA